ncbi:MAG: alpha/beta fold hydrolase, partial [Nitriliruptoraceae bacterium]
MTSDPSTLTEETSKRRALAYADSRFARLAGIEVHHEVQGDADAPAVLLSHHFYGSTRTWRHLIDDLARDHLVTAFDRPGFGLTERPDRRPHRGGSYFDRDTAARIGWKLLDHLGVGRAVLVGSSAGGTNVLEMYAQRPERVRALVLIAPAITGDVGPPAPLRPLLRKPPFRSLGPRVVRRLAGEIDVARISRAWFDPSRATAADAEPYQRMLAVEGWERGLWEVVTAERPPDLRALLATLKVPTLVVTGDHDGTIAPSWSRQTAAAIPGARF